jgi:integrase
MASLNALSHRRTTKFSLHPLSLVQIICQADDRGLHRHGVKIAAPLLFPRERSRSRPPLACRWLMYEFALATGMRQSEILGLTWDDVDDSPAVSVTEQLSRGRAAERERVALKNPDKPHAKRRIVLSEDWKSKLAAHKLAQRPGYPWVFPNGRFGSRGQGASFARSMPRSSAPASTRMRPSIGCATPTARR